MAFLVDGVLAVREIGPHLVGEELVLRRRGPVLVVLRVQRVVADDLLQEHDVRSEHAQPVAQVMHDHPLVEVRKALVDIVGGDGQ